MKPASASFRGQPLLTLGLLLIGWVALRASLWQPPLAEVARPVVPAPNVVAPASAFPLSDMWHAPVQARQLVPARDLPRYGGAGGRIAAIWPATGPPGGDSPLQEEPRLSLHPGNEQGLQAAPFPFLKTAAQQPGADRWSADAWLLMRRDTVTPATSGRGSYGRSQIGGVLRYRLAPFSAHRPAAYLRFARALAGEQENEVGLGLTARPFARVPLALATELRLGTLQGAVHARPAAYVVSELPPFDLPGGFSGETYFQAGYVAGANSTVFADGQARVTRRLLAFGPAELSTGAGVWGGAQKGASRLDIGPGATLKLDLGETHRRIPARLSLDWRFRVAGEAEPDSGPSLTVSAGF